MTAFLIVFCGGLAVLALVSPLWALCAFWFMTLNYPQTILSGTLPGRIRLDDAFLVWITICCMRLNRPGALSARSFRIAVVWFISILLGNIVGELTGPAYMLRTILAGTGKALYVPMLAYALNSVVTTDREMRRMVTVIILASMASCGIAVLQVYRPELTAAWEVPIEDVFRRTIAESADVVSDVERRAGGALGGVMMSIVAFSVALLSLRMVVRSTAWNERMLYGAALVVSAATLGYTQTRGAIAGFAVAVLYSIVVYRRRALMLVVVGLGSILIVTRSDLVGRVGERVLGVRGRLDESAALRSAFWQDYISNPSMHYLFFGRGMTAETVRQNLESAHSTYVGAVAYTGLFGVVVLVWLLIKSWRMCRDLRRHSTDPWAGSLGEGVALCMIAMMVNGLSAEVWQVNYLFMFTLIILVDIRLRWHEQWAYSAEPIMPTAPVAAFPVIPAFGSAGSTG